VVRHARVGAATRRRSSSLIRHAAPAAPAGTTLHPSAPLPMSPALDFRPLTPADYDATAVLLHRALVHWYQTRLGQGARFGDRPEGFRLFPEVYGALDAGHDVAAFDRATGALLGVCFVHPRDTHVSVGIVATAPEAQGRGIARAMLAPVVAAARARGLPVRLVSSLLNLDSFSLYSRLGFVPHTLYQDLALDVPAAGLAHPPPPGIERVAPVTATAAAGELADLEHTLQGIRRERDYALFLDNRVGDWRVWASRDASGRLEGFLVASLHPACPMLGPGAAVDEAVAAALAWRALDAFRGRSVVYLVPSSAGSLVRLGYAWGAKNVELHAAQAVGAVTPARGVAFPTFLPETG
jgi:GNAT superfamily N-acetyltransferase